MSLALLAQGETVPRRGITTTSSPVGRAGVGIAVGQQRRQLVDIGRGRRGVEGHPVHVARGHAGDARAHARQGLQRSQKGAGAEVGQRIAALEVHQCQGGRQHGGHFTGPVG